MIKEVDRLFEAITGPEWRMENEETGELVKYNPDKTRQLFYVGSDIKWGNAAFADMGLRFLNNHGGWDEVICIKQVCRPDKEKVEISVRAGGIKMDSLVWYYGGRTPYYYGAAIEGLIDDRRVLEDRQELLFVEDELPDQIDLDLTANLFVDQMIRGEMERPVLVPEGMIKEDWCFRPAGEFLKMAEDSQDPTEKKIYGLIARIQAKQQ